jgi:hypothetical protein
MRGGPSRLGLLSDATGIALALLAGYLDVEPVRVLLCSAPLRS